MNDKKHHEVTTRKAYNSSRIHGEITLATLESELHTMTHKPDKIISDALDQAGLEVGENEQEIEAVRTAIGILKTMPGNEGRDPNDVTISLKELRQMVEQHRDKGKGEPRA